MTDNGILRKTDWTLEPSTIQAIADDTIEEAKKSLDKIAKTPAGEETLATLQALEEVGGSTGEKLGPLIFLKYVSDNKEQREACDEVEKQAEKFDNEVWGRKDLYDVIARLEPHVKTYGAEEQTLLKQTLDEFRHRGAGLPDAERKEFLEISNNLTVLEADFNTVLNEITTTVPCTAEELDGVPPPIYEHLEKDGDAYLLPLDYPILVPVLNYAHNPETRKRMQTAQNQRGGKENSERLSDALALRDRLAKIAGFNNFAEYQISIKMAKTPKRIFDFMNDLKEKLTPLFEKELVVFKELKAKTTGIPIEDVKFELWDLFYYHELLRKEKYSVDQNEVKEYFPMERVVKGVLEVYQTVLNLEFTKIDEPNVWHEDVLEYKVVDKVSGKRMGHFYLDLYPRDGKFKHYAVFDFLNRRVKDGKALLPITSMVANFQKPTENQPSLLTHSEVETFFHEFGHLMHVITNQASYARFGLDGVLPDFIEVPSMLLENWAWKEDVLKLLSGHYKDPDKKLPSELLDRMLKAKLLDVGAFTLRQVFFSLIDMYYHTEPVEDTTAKWYELFSEITGFDLMPDTTPDASFGHLMGGYQAGYYGYQWSKVYAEDVFTKFEENGYLDEKTGLEYREKILSPGGSRDPDEMVRDFLGRESDNKAYLKSLGIDN
ncbi:MAG: M3 family metallopeptidase [Candidatus Thorarchaeota archaeon]